MTEPIEFDPADTVVAGATGQPGQRRFLIQAGRGGASLTVLVEKEQVAVLSARLLQLLSQLDEYLPADDEPTGEIESAPLEEAVEPLFRARMMRIGFDTGRDMVVLELFEDSIDEDDLKDDTALEDPEEILDGYMARIYATRAQMRLVAERGAEAVAGGRPQCRLCMLPIDPEGHDCPSRN